MRRYAIVFSLLIVAPFALADVVTIQPDAASDCDQIAVVWASEGRILGARVPIGNHVITDGTVLGTGAWPRIAFTSGTYFVAWTDGPDLVFRRFTADGTAIDASPITIASGAIYDFAIAAGEDGIAVVWFADRYVLHSAWIDLDGSVRVTSDSLFSNVVPPGLLQIAWDGSRFLVSWGQQKGLCSFCINPAFPMMVLLDDRAHALLSIAQLPAVSGFKIVGGDGRFLMLASGEGTDSYIVDSNGVMSQKRALWSRTWGPLNAVWTGTEFLALVSEYEVRISADNVPSDPNGDAPGMQVLPQDTWTTALVVVRGVAVAVYPDAAARINVRIVKPERRRRAAR